MLERMRYSGEGLQREGSFGDGSWVLLFFWILNQFLLKSEEVVSFEFMGFYFWRFWQVLVGFSCMNYVRVCLFRVFRFDCFLLVLQVLYWGQFLVFRVFKGVVFCGVCFKQQFFRWVLQSVVCVFDILVFRRFCFVCFFSGLIFFFFLLSYINSISIGDRLGGVQSRDLVRVWRVYCFGKIIYGCLGSRWVFIFVIEVGGLVGWRVDSVGDKRELTEFWIGFQVGSSFFNRSFVFFV